MDRAERRMEKFDRRLKATQRLVEAAGKIIARLPQGQKQLLKSQSAFLDWFRQGGHGSRRATQRRRIQTLH